MAVEEYKDKAGKEWTKFTGEDLPKAKGLLTEAGNEAYRKAFHENEGQYVRLSDPNGNPTEVHKRDLDQALAQGYGKVAIAPRQMIDGFGGMKKIGAVRFKSGKGWKEIWYADGRHERVEVS